MNKVRRWGGWKHELIPAWCSCRLVVDTFLRCYVIRIVGSSSSRPPLPGVCGYLHRLDRGGPQNCTLALVKIFPRYCLYWSSFMFFKKRQTRNAIKCLGYEAPPAAGRAALRPDPRIINVETRTNCANNSANNSCLRNWLPIASCPSARYNLLGIGQASMQPSWAK